MARHAGGCPLLARALLLQPSHIMRFSCPQKAETPASAEIHAGLFIAVSIPS